MVCVVSPVSIDVVVVVVVDTAVVVAVVVLIVDGPSENKGPKITNFY